MLYIDVSLETKIKDLERRGYTVIKEQTSKPPIKLKVYEGKVKWGFEDSSKWEGHIGLKEELPGKILLFACTKHGIGIANGSILLIENNKIFKSPGIAREIVKVIGKDFANHIIT